MNHLPPRHEDIKPEITTLPGTSSSTGVIPEPDPQPEDEEIPSPNQVPRGPSPEPKIEDSECHRSQSAM